MVYAYLCTGHTVLCQSLPCLDLFSRACACACLTSFSRLCWCCPLSACVLKSRLCVCSTGASTAQRHTRLCLMPFVNRCTGGGEAQLRLSEVEVEAVPTRKELTMPVPKTAVAHGDVNLDVHAFLAKFKA